jgi:prepilin-type N-terminal cleavage/methylation domain-containing protein
MKRYNKNVCLGRKAFTLIELMVVIAIIAILVGLVFTALTKATQSAKKAKAKVQVKQLEKAFTAYFDEYGEWPKEMTSCDANADENNLTGIELEEKCALMLAGKATAGTSTIYNDHEIEFIPKAPVAMSNDGSDSKKGYLDPWGHCYKYMMDFNDDGNVKVQYSNALGSGNKTEIVSGQGVVVWSRGQDGIDNIGGDDITSWRTQ